VSANKKAQSTIEYLVIVAMLLLMLIGIYWISLDLTQRRQLIESQMEGERVASSLALAIGAATQAGNGYYADIFVQSYPNQTLIVSTNNVIALGPQNSTVAIVPLYSNLTNFTAEPLTFRANQRVRINRTGDVIYVQPLG